MEKFLNTVVCPNCNGAGYFEQYKHIADGVCFKCGGDCVVKEWDTKPLPPVTKAEARAQYLDSLQNETEIEKELDELDARIKPLEEKQQQKITAIRIFEESKEKYKDLPTAEQLNKIFDEGIETANKELAEIEQKLNPLKAEFRNKLDKLIETRKTARE